MLTTADPAEIPGLLRKTLGHRWDVTIDGNQLQIRHQDRATPYQPPRHSVPWLDLLALLEAAFADQGVPRAACLPLRCGRETELTVSAVQALDPILKDGGTIPYRQGFIPQPVVRLTARRGPDGSLQDGFLTSFVNTSRVEPLPDLETYATAFDRLLTILSRLSLHARHITLRSHLAIWRRRQVEGITLRFDHAGTSLGDLVLLWNAAHPDRHGLDLGTSLERLAWARSRTPWPDLIFGPLSRAAPHDTLDAIRTATLLLAHGITPSAPQRRKHHPPSPPTNPRSHRRLGPEPRDPPIPPLLAQRQSPHHQLAGCSNAGGQPVHLERVR
ncbi:hypothetical protein FH609_002365 [Streptomyces sp. 3MP-14]|uniref:Uncharacterized protein n=1 Tax=Streptomyces mimosae TaxID=2586635 RepID=A0A5N6ART0_9ACTN|nr:MULTISPECIES: hypothetical protein [Streptomyces]KAB8170806.1 hypothetical protein FH607_000105 [Streptomyces mimosae]KAB8179841.1 hypothetical protein FH609_002365 [Streptomyces sp. 3MP-14]